MVHADCYRDVIEAKDGRVVRTVVAVWGARRKIPAGSMPVYRIDDLGREECRCLWFSCYGGYTVDTTGSERWCVPMMKLQHFRHGRYMQTRTLSEEEKAVICSVYPDFRYTLQKAGEISVAGAMELLVEWKRNPRVELLLAAGYRKLLHNGSFARMTNARQKAVLAYLRKNEEAARWNLDKVLFVMSGKGSADEFDAWKEFRERDGRQVPFAWWKRYGDESAALTRYRRDTYRDYIHMAQRCGHDVEEDYWKWPRDIKKAHDKVMEEYNRVLEAERLERGRAVRRQEREKRKKFLAVASAFSRATARSGGLKAYIPQDIKAVRDQARVLHQCLVSMDYIGDMASRECLLVFIADSKGNPVATAEIMPNGNVGQFYGDEAGHEDEKMKPGPEAVKVLEKWLGKFRESAVKAMKEAA